MTDFLVKRGELRECRIAESAAPGVGPGQALLRVERFGLTANNVTYAVMGEAMSYWDFFPAAEGWGRVPMWGFAEVERSEAEGVAEGTRLYGYLPSSSHLLVTPGSVNGEGFVDRSPHRAALPSAYHRYLASGADPFYRADTEAAQMLLRPLFFTSFTIDDQIDDEGLAGRGPVLISSASSKTAIGTAFLLARRKGVELVGLTSARNLAFVEGLGVYDRAVPYEEIGSLERGPATYVDVAGDGGVRRAVHSRFGDELIESMAVGLTHWEELGTEGEELPGPAPQLFFAPDRIVKRSADWGPEGLGQRAADAWHPFCEWVEGWLEVTRREGFEAVRDTWLEVLEGRVEPQTAHTISLAGARLTPGDPQTRPSPPGEAGGRVRGIDRSLNLFRGARRAAALALIAVVALGAAQAQAQPRASGDDGTGGEARASIVGGKVASISSYPWLAYIAYRGPVDNFGCTGTVVAPRLVLTAAHCVLTGTGRVAEASNFTVLTGVADLREATPEQASPVAQVLVFPEYQPARVLNDAGLLVLAEPVAAPALPVAGPADAALFAGGTPVAVAGWGLISVDPPRLPATLREAQTVLKNPRYCQRRLRRVLSTYSPAGQACIQSRLGSLASVCNGDSGGPGIARRPDGSPVLVGIVSLKGALDCDPLSPQVLARADRVSSWVAAWIAAIEAGAPPPAIVVPKVVLPPVTRRDAELVAWLGLEADFGRRFTRGQLHRIGCRRINREKVKCAVQWLRGGQLYRGAITIYTALPREGFVYNYRYTIRRFGLGCWLRNPNPIRACNPRLFKR